MYHLKLIPRESPEINFQINSIRKDKGISSFLEKIKSLKEKLSQKNLSQDDKVMHTAAQKLFSLLESPEKYGSLEIGHTIDYLYRTILSLQRKKSRMLKDTKTVNKKKKA